MKLTARMVGSQYRFSRVTRAYERGSFLVIQLLRDHPDLTGAQVSVKWSQTTRPWTMQILSVAVDCERAS